MQRTVVERIEPVAEDIVSLVLRTTDGPLEAWEPGAHIDIVLPNWLTRQYSLCGDPHDRTSYRVAVRHDHLSRGGSEYITQFLRRGRELAVSAPRNTFSLADAPDYLFVAGGIGITAVTAMFRAAVEAGRRARLVYAGRTRESMAFAEELSAEHGKLVQLATRQHGGRPDLTALAAGIEPDTLVYCCGPAPMLEAAKTAFPPDRLHLERFRAVPRTHGPDTAFTVRCARSERTIDIDADESMLDGLITRGIPTSSGCREGVCGSCEIRVFDGEPDHRDDLDAPPGRMYPCVSRAQSSRLVVDL